MSASWFTGKNRKRFFRYRACVSGGKKRGFCRLHRRVATHHDPSTQVSFVPPPCEEFTTSEPSRNATRVRPPGTTVTSFPDSTKGRRSMCLGASPAATKVGDV